VARHLGGTLALALVTLFLISVVTFLATNAAPADPARLALGRAATGEQLELYRRQQHLDDPVVERYGRWLADFVRGDWGTSVVNRRDVRDEVGPRVVRTIIVGLAGMAIAIPLAFAVGVYTGQRSGSKTDVGVSVVSLFLNSLPEFVIGLLLLLALAVKARWLPVESSDALFGDGADRAKAYALPILTLAVVMCPYLIRMVRVNVRDTVEQPYVRSAVLRGLPGRLVTHRHVLPNASLPVVSVVALNMAELIGGLVVIEAVFAFPGIGQLLVESVLGADIPTVQAIALIIGVGFVALNFLADGMLLLLDPRLRRG
jgi:peptide/nickel transport system permease protein